MIVAPPRGAAGPSGGGRTVAVVGSGGFIGRRACAALEENGHRVLGFDRSRPVSGPRGLSPEVAAADWVVWAASSINPMIAENDPDRVGLDLEAFDLLLAGLAGAGSNARVLLLSSGGTVYDEAADPPYAETSPTRPRNAYGRAKLALEHRLHDAAAPGLVLRVSNAYGPGQPVAPGQGVVSHWLHAVAGGQDLHVFGDMSVARDYVHVDDVVRALVLAVEAGAPPDGVLNVGAGEPTSLEHLLATVRATVGGTPVVVHHHPSRSFDARSTWLDCRRAAETLGWRPLTSLADGIAGTWRAVSAGSVARAAAPGAAGPR